MKLRTLVTIFSVVATLTGCVSTMTKQATSGPPSVSFIEPIDGAEVSGEFRIKFAVSGMEVRRAGDITPNTGHFHLLINKPAVKQGESIAFLDQQEIHFSQGQTETPILLPPGKHQLTVQFANGAHESYGVDMSRTINVTVK